MYDAVIIGSGLGGLVCGALLAKAGKNVLVLERQQQLGGCMQSYKRRGLSFDTGLHYIGGLGEGQRLHRAFSFLGLMQLPWHRLDAEGFDYVTVGERTFRFAEGFEQFADALAEDFPQQRAALRKYAQLLQKVEESPLESQDMYSMFGQSAYDYLSETFSDPLLVNVLAGTALKMEVRRDTLPLFTFVHGNCSFVGSSWRLKGSGNLLVEALADSIRRAGGQLICGVEAEELLQRDGQLTAVRCKKGESYEGRVFISDVHPALTFDMVKDGNLLRGIFRRRISSIENTVGMFTVSLVLKPGALRYFNHNKFVYSKPNVWTLTEETGGVGGVMLSARVPEDGSEFVRQIDLLTPMSWSRCQQWQGTGIGRRGAEYDALKERLADECVALAETVVPGLGGMVEQRYASTPLTWHDYTLTPAGSAYGMRKDWHNPMLTMLSPRTPIPNLLLTGQNLLLHGVEGVTMTALQTCGEILGKDYIQNIII